MVSVCLHLATLVAVVRLDPAMLITVSVMQDALLIKTVVQI